MTPALKFVVAVGTVIVLGIAAFYTVNASIYHEKQEPTAIVPYRATLSGEFVCLPHTDTSGPQTTECAFGLKTDSGEYYAIDFNLMSQTPPQLATGERFSASGTITPVEMLSSNHWQQYPIVGIFSVTDSVERRVQACDADAKICPDGSSVGRSGPRCEFAECPSVNATVGTVTTYLGGSATSMNITVNPKVVVSDSRCPQGVQCVWAGTVEVRTVISSQVAHGEHVLTLGESQQFGDFTVTLTDVTPGKSAESEISDSSYRFTFRIEKR